MPLMYNCMIKILALDEDIEANGDLSHENIAVQKYAEVAGQDADM